MGNPSVHQYRMKIFFRNACASLQRHAAVAVSAILGCLKILEKDVEFSPMRYRMIFCAASALALMACQFAPAPETEPGGGLNPFAAAVRLYRGPLNHLSALRVGECPMYPSDSEYSLQALKKHGAVMGWIMSIDRVVRCGRDETRLAPQVFVNGTPKSYDPVEENDFWWSPE